MSFLYQNNLVLNMLLPQPKIPEILMALLFK
jgi:hypothetical protein